MESRGIVLAVVLGIAGCGGGDATTGRAPNDEPAEPAAEQTSAEEECGADARKDTYAPGLAKQSADVEVSIVEATPAPPAKGTNVMTFAVRDAEGPLDGATIFVKPYMPDHGHGSAWTPIVRPLGGGSYEVDKVELPMAGRWTLLVEVQRGGRSPEHVTYSFCISD